MNVHIDRSLKCPKCPRIFQNEAARYGHLRNNHGEKSFTCEKCGKVYENRGSFVNHCKQHSINEGTAQRFKCSICDASLVSNFALRNHFKVRHAPKQPCEVCGKMVPSGDKYYVHLKTHQPVVCSFEGCNLEFEHKGIMTYHLKNEHENKPVNCPVCNVEYGSAYKLTHHIYRQHKKQWKCEVEGCTFVATVKTYMRSHIKCKHKNLSEDVKLSLLDTVKSRYEKNS
jgi:KRAB domain-containing zinc finger protein